VVITMVKFDGVKNSRNYEVALRSEIMVTYYTADVYGMDMNFQRQKFPTTSNGLKMLYNKGKGMQQSDLQIITETDFWILYFHHICNIPNYICKGLSASEPSQGTKRCRYDIDCIGKLVYRFLLSDSNSMCGKFFDDTKAVANCERSTSENENVISAEMFYKYLNSRKRAGRSAKDEI